MRPATSGGGLWRDPVLLAFGALGALTAVWFLLGPGGAVVSCLEQVLLDVCLVVLCGRVVRMSGAEMPVRRFWRALLAGGCFFTIGDGLLTLAAAGLPIGRFAGTAQSVLVCLGVGVVVWVMLTYPVDAQGSERLRLWLDATTLITAVAVFAWYFAVGGRLGEAGAGDLVVTVVGCGIVLLSAFGVIRLLLSGSAPYTLAAGVAGSVSVIGMVVAQSLQSVLSGAAPTVLMVQSCILFSATPRIQELQTRSRERAGGVRTRRRYSRLPYVAVFATQAMLVWGLHDLGVESRTWGAVVGLAVITGLVVTRQLLAFHDNAELLASLVASMAEARKLHGQLRHKATHDALTGLANRALFDERLEAVQSEARPAAILVIDLDDFKIINDTHGHHMGDGILVEVAERLRHCVRTGDTIARLGGDEFAVLLPDAELTDAHRIADRVAAILNEPAQVSGVRLPLHASIGVAAGPSGQVATLLRTADAVMYEVKQSGKGGYRLKPVLT